MPDGRLRLRRKPARRIATARTGCDRSRSRGWHRSTVRILSVMLDPARAAGIDAHGAWVVDGTPPAGSHVRNGILCATDGHGAHTTVVRSLQRWVGLMCGASSWDASMADGDVHIDGDPSAAARLLACTDLTGTVG